MAKNKKDRKADEAGNPQDPTNLSYDERKSSFRLDVDDNDPDWEHPADYDTLSLGGSTDDSTYDSANPYVGDEYADLDELKEDNLRNQGMHIAKNSDLKILKKDEELSQNEEDFRDDLDEEGYPKNDRN